ncbi:MAG: LysR family transcriptional regulator [Peptococcaceae bacterium]|nr:LysR family transcriptional regulator [Peptococcaceae bacterium]
MNLSQLQYFQVVAEEEHISHAAEKLHISQPSLSTTIQRLEAELDTPLFDRRGRNIRLNAAGKRLLDHTHHIFACIDTLDKDFHQLEFNLANRVSLAINNPMFLSGWLADFLLAHPDLRLTQSTMREEDMLQGLMDEDLDIALGDFGEVPQGIEKRVLASDEYMVMMAPSHHLANRRALLFADIQNEAFVSLPSGSINCMIHLLFAQKNATPNVIFEGEQTLILRMVLAGRALLFTSRDIIRIHEELRATSPSWMGELAEQTTVMLPITDLDTDFQLSICWKKDHTPSIMAQTLRTALLETYSQDASIQQ